MNDINKCCGQYKADFNQLSANFFKQFDSENKYGEWSLFSQMKKDLSILCEEMARSCDCNKECSPDQIVEDFFSQYASLDKYLSCHLADQMKSEMKKMCQNFEAYLEKIN